MQIRYLSPCTYVGDVMYNQRAEIKQLMCDIVVHI